MIRMPMSSRPGGIRDRSIETDFRPVLKTSGPVGMLST